MISKNGQPIFLVFYLERELMMNSGVIQPFVNSVNDVLTQREANAMAFFLPTDKEPKIECINPIQLQETDMEHVNTVLSELTKAFDMPEQK